MKERPNQRTMLYLLTIISQKKCFQEEQNMFASENALELGKRDGLQVFE